MGFLKDLRRLALVLCLPLAAGHPEFMDRATTPGRDFYQYAVGGWLERTPIPPQESEYGVDEEIEQRTFGILRDILEEPGGAGRKAGAFYAAGMDLAGIERAGAAPLARDFAGIQAVRDRPGLARALARLHRRGSAPAFGFSVGPDDKHSSQNIATLSQGGLGLPEADYYLLPDPRSRALRRRYRDHIARMFVLLGDAPAPARRRAATVLAMETRLASASMDRVRRRDPEAVYHRMSRGELAAAAPGLDWDGYFEALGAAPEAVLVRQPDFFRELGRMAALPPAHWRAYLRWHLILDTATHLSSRFDRASFAFYGRTLRGVREQQPRWKRMVGLADDALGELLGRLYVERAFPPGAKARVEEMVARLRAALGARIRELPWLGATARGQALAKLDAMAVRVGHPERWRDYSALRVGPCHVANVLAARTFEFDRALARIGRPVDRAEWDVSPATNNAFYDPTQNQIVLPAGILQPPYFDLEGDDAANYGGIGATIGHEMTHGFDDEGRHYDAQGNLGDGWSAAEARDFEARAALMVRQFAEFEPLPGRPIDGRATLGENIADLGGLKLAFAAFQASRAGQPSAVIDGFTPEQRFFLAYAWSWRSRIRPEALRDRLMSDVHAPAKYRVNGPLANLPEFHEAFGIRDGEAMKRPEAERPVIW